MDKFAQARLGGPEMDRYLIESPHSEKQCLQAAQTTFAAGYLLTFEWGCEAGVHVAYAMIESENEKQALLVVPPNLRNDARAIMLVKYDGSYPELRAKLDSFMKMSKAELIDKIEGIVNGNYEKWSIGITNDLDRARAKSPREWALIGKADSEQIARDVQKFFGDQGMGGGLGPELGPGEANPTFVFIFSR